MTSSRRRRAYCNNKAQMIQESSGEKDYPYPPHLLYGPTRFKFKNPDTTSSLFERILCNTMLLELSFHQSKDSTCHGLESQQRSTFVTQSDSCSNK